ncbi:MAG TPA: glycosyltransferase family 2 protein [Anaerolineales bacterium]|nr:glycosyltransferase family 2 protein [Anaerolineales bacterium]
MPQVPEGITFLILARDEACVLGETLTSLTGAVSREDRIHVVADGCRDATAEVAAGRGAVVHVRKDTGVRGKGVALRWWLAQTRCSSTPMDAIVLLDADTRLGPGFVPAIRRRLARGEPVIQARLEPEVRNGDPLIRLAAFSDIVEQQVYDAWNARMGWPVRIRGTGTAFRRWALERATARLQTSAEDLEMTLVLAAERIGITFANEVSVADPKPRTLEGAEGQRARWFKGQLQTLRTHPDLVGRLLLQGPRGLAVLSSVLLKPKALVMPLKTVITLLAALLAAQSGGAAVPIAIGGVIWLGLDVGGVLYGLRFVSERRKTLLAMLSCPAYLILWLRSVFLAARSRDPWLRSRPAATAPSEGGLDLVPDNPH